MLIGTLGDSLLGNLLAGKATIKAGEGTIRAGRPEFLMSPHSLTNFEIQKPKFWWNEPKFNSVYLRNNLPKIKDGTYVMNLGEFKSLGTHWIALHVNGNNVIYFESFGVEHILKEIKKFKGNTNLKTNICRR